MASHMAYLPFEYSPVTRKRQLSPTTAIVRPSVGVLKLSGALFNCLLGLLAVDHATSFSLYQHQQHGRRSLPDRYPILKLDAEKGPQAEGQTIR